MEGLPILNRKPGGWKANCIQGRCEWSKIVYNLFCARCPRVTRHGIWRAELAAALVGRSSAGWNGQPGSFEVAADGQEEWLRRLPTRLDAIDYGAETRGTEKSWMRRDRQAHPHSSRPCTARTLNSGSRPSDPPLRHAEQSALEAFGHQIDLPRTRARRLRLADHHLLERAAHVLEKLVGAFALAHLDHVIAAGLEHLANHVEGKFHQVHRGSLVGSGDAADVRRDVRHDQVGLPAVEHVENLLEHGVLGEVALNEIDVIQPAHRQDVGGQHPALLADDSAGHLRPAARRGTEIHDQHAGAYQFVLLVQLDQLVAGARAQAILLRAFDEGIVDVFIQPTTAAFGSFHDRANHGESS